MAKPSTTKMLKGEKYRGHYIYVERMTNTQGDVYVIAGISVNNDPVKFEVIGKTKKGVIKAAKFQLDKQLR
jgi:hypothetical protein